MEQMPKPTIKGLYVNSHIDALRALKGEEGVALLKQKVGFPIDYGVEEDVFIGDEESIINALVMVLHPETPQDRLEIEAGRLHFTNWTATPWSKQLFGLLPQDFKYMMLHLNVIIVKVFQNFVFNSEELGPCKVKVMAQNNYYSPNHWVGLFQAWMEAFGLKGTVVAEPQSAHDCNFILQWEEQPKA